jgi:hypothetical protein
MPDSVTMEMLSLLGPDWELTRDKCTTRQRTFQFINKAGPRPPYMGEEFTAQFPNFTYALYKISGIGWRTVIFTK